MENMCEIASLGKIILSNLQAAHGYFILKAKSPTWKDIQVCSHCTQQRSSIIRFQHSGWYTRENTQANPDVFIGKVLGVSSTWSMVNNSLTMISPNLTFSQIAHGSYDNW